MTPVTYLPTAGPDAPTHHDPRPLITTPEAAAHHLTARIYGPAGAHRDPHNQEATAVLMLDVKHRLIAAEVTSTGTLANTFMDPATIYRRALTTPGCACIVVAHNHPSGDPEPSPDDLAVTRRLAKASDLLGIDLLDALVIGTAPGTNQPWTSLARRGAL